MKRLKWVAAMLALLAYILTKTLTDRPLLVEEHYAQAIYPVLARVLSATLGRLPFSLSEVLLGLLLLYPILHLARNRTWRSLASLATSLAVLACLLYFSFVTLWGLNYYRMPLGDIMGLPMRDSHAQELSQLSEHLIRTANEIRVHIDEDDDGVMVLSDSRRESLQRVQAGYDEAQVLVPQLAGSYSTPKSPAISLILSYLGIAGIYSPFTGEAHVNTHMPDSLIPATAVHEAAHQRGFNREDEADFIAYFVCSLHPDADFRYSGTLLALNHAMRALYRADRHAFIEAVSLYSPGLRRDLNYVRSYWQQFEGPAERAAERVNDAYLRANQQQDGVASYGRMVDLLLAYARDAGIVDP